MIVLLHSQKSYWLGRSVDEVKEQVTPPIQNSTFFEEDPKGIPAGVQVKGLTKVKRTFIVILLILRDEFLFNTRVTHSKLTLNLEKPNLL